MITFTEKTNSAHSHSLDKTKRNILLIGKAETKNKAKIILNPMTIENAEHLYGLSSDLTNAYRTSFNIANDAVIYTINCPLYTDFIEIMDTVTQYNFDFIVPLDIYFRDSFYNPSLDKQVSFTGYILEKLRASNSDTVLVMTDYNSSLYDDMDMYMAEMNTIFEIFESEYNSTINNCGNNLIFVLNNFTEDTPSNAILAASLSAFSFDKYPANLKFKTYFDIDYSDVKNKSMCFYKYHPSTQDCSIEQLYNCRYTNDIYKKVLIDILIKHVVKQLDLHEYNGSLYNPYIHIKIENKVKKIMDELSENCIVDYKINSISFNKTGVGVGTIMINLSITPHSILEKLNIVMEL